MKVGKSFPLGPCLTENPWPEIPPEKSENPWPEIPPQKPEEKKD
jgi:hypothetical protein